MFTMRITKPEPGNKFYITTGKGGYSYCIAGSPTDAGCNVLANCVGYACGRFNEETAQATGYKGMKYPYLNCNAENFIERAQSFYNLKVSQVPVVGGIMVWQKGATLRESDGAGHVAIVEAVYSDGSILTSESGYGARTAFWTTKRTNSNGVWGQSNLFKYRGCIVNPNVPNTITPVVTPVDPKKATKCPFVEPNYVLDQARYKNVSNTGVKWLQWYLYKLGLYNDAIDGYFGNLTKNAVIKFQQAHTDVNGRNLDVDGSVFTLTRGALVAVYNGNPLPRKQPTPAPTPAPDTFKVGDKIKIAKNSKYTSGGYIPSWVLNSTLYCREINGNVVIFSVLKTGAVTGATLKSNVSKA